MVDEINKLQGKERKGLNNNKAKKKVNVEGGSFGVGNGNDGQKTDEQRQ